MHRVLTAVFALAASQAIAPGLAMAGNPSPASPKSSMSSVVEGVREMFDRRKIAFPIPDPKRCDFYKQGASCDTEIGSEMLITVRGGAPLNGDGDSKDPNNRAVESVSFELYKRHLTDENLRLFINISSQIYVGLTGDKHSSIFQKIEAATVKTLNRCGTKTSMQETDSPHLNTKIDCDDRSLFFQIELQ